MSDVVRLQGLKVTVFGQYQIFYANALNGEPAIRGVVLDYKGAEILQDLRLELLVTSMGKAMAHPFVQRIPLLKPETAVETRVHWDAAALFEVVEPQPGEVHLNLYHEDALVHSEVTPVEIASPLFGKIEIAGSHACSSMTIPSRSAAALDALANSAALSAACFVSFPFLVRVIAVMAIRTS